MGIFDDLIPADEVGLFDDLLPRKEPEKLRVSPGDMPEADGAGDIPQDDPTPSSLGMRSAQRQTSLSPQVGGPRTAPPAEPVTPEPVVNRGNPDTTDDARAERGFGRSAYLDDGAMPDVQPNAVTRTAQRPADPPPMAAQAATRDDPFEGEGFGSLAKRRGQQAAKGATEVIASVPEALAILDRDITRQRHGSALEAVPALRKEREDLNRIIADTEKDDPRNRAARMRLTNVEGEILRAANMVREDSASLETPVEDTGMFGVGGKIRQSSEDVFGAPDPRDTSFWAGVAEGAGNMTALAGASIIAGPAGLGVGAGLGSSLNSSQIYKEARAAGVDEETALAASRWAGAIGATEIIPISRALKLLPPRLRPKVSNTLMKRFADIAQGSGEEAAQEYLATVANNLVAQKFYDPERGWDEGAAEGALVGAVLGGGMGLVGSVAGRDGETPASKPPEPQGAPPRPDYGNSPLLTPEDRESPIADDVIGEGKEIVDSIVRGETPPRPPQAGVQPLDQGGADVLTPQQSVVQEPSAIDRLSPTPPAQPTPESAPAAAPEQAAEGVVGRPVEDRPALQMPETEDREQVGGDDDFFEEEVDGQPTGRMMRIDPETGGVVPVETQAAPEAVEPQQESNDQARQEPAPQDENVEISAPPAEGPRPTSQSGVVVLENEDLTSIEADPETFQYKSGGDAQGVTDRLTGVRQWDNMKAGQAVVYEYSDGRRVVADGHQRLGLAKRMRGEGQDVAMPVTVLREADGVTPEDAMVRAAMKNIAEADGRNPDPQQVIDAAKVMRARPDISLEDMNLPTGDRAALGRNAKAVSTLSDDAFGMVVNERASIRSAAAVAKMVPDKAAQANVLDIVEKSGAKNIFEAEQVARQAAADTVVQTQDSLFGSESVTESLYVERARVMDRAIKRLRNEASAFKTILKNSGTIEAVGQNRVDADASSKKAAEDAAVQEYITRLANSKGPISDALTEAAKSLKSGGDSGQAVTRFVQAVRSATQDGDAGGAASGASGRADERAGQAPEGQGQDGLVRQVGEPSSNAQSTWEAASKEKRTEIVSRIPGLDSLNRRMLANADWRGMTDAQTAAVSRAISEPATERTEAGEQQVIPGAEQDAARSESAREADQRREVGARQQQSRMRSAAPQDEPGGLFDTQGDMLDQAEQDEAVSVRPDGSDNTSRKYQRRNDTFAAELMSELAANDDIFSYPKAQSNTLEGVFAEIFPAAQYQGEMSPQDITADDPDAEKHLFELPNGEPFFVYRTDDEVWFDVSNLEEGGFGNALYAAMGDYAYNSGRKFIGDPEGLSEIALRRRTDAMLSSALKHGTTEHLAPHAYQRSGDENLGVPPLEWREGDHLGNIQSLIEVSTESLAHYVPEFRRARYDFSTRTFRNSEGAPITADMLREWASEHPRVREARAGRRTLKRGIILNTILRAEGGDRPELLERVSGRGAQPVGAELRGTFYQRKLAAFYSPLVRALEGAKQKKAPAKDWKAIIGKLPGVKKAEIEWLGVEEWLDAQDGQVTREELADFVRESQIEVVEDVGTSGAGEIDIRFDDSYGVDEEGRQEFVVYEDIAGRGRWEAEGVMEDGLYVVDGQTFDDRFDVVEWARDQVKQRDGSFETSFDEYTEPGGENYREVLLRVPNLHETGKNREGDKRPFVQSAHFEQENIVVHARVKDREGPNGEKVLFVEEIQSDLASVWRENQEDPAVTARRQELEREISTREERIAEVMPDAVAAIQEAYFRRVKEQATDALIANDIRHGIRNMDAFGVPRGQVAPSQAEARDLLREYDGELYDKILGHLKEARDFQDQLIRQGTQKSIPEGTPDTPFKEEHTYSLMTKRLLRMAAEEGYDRVSWTPGYMQAERWNKAGQSVVENVEWSPGESPGVESHRYVDIEMAQGGRTITSVVDEKGVIYGAAGNSELEGKPLASLIGPSLARQVMSESSGKVSGQKITFPDSGYAIAYDQQTRKAVDKLAKGTGAKVYVDKTLPDMQDAAIRDMISRPTMGEPVADRPVWSIDITDALRSKALEPMAILRRDSALDEQKVQSLLPELRKRLDKLMVRNVDLRFDPAMSEQGATEISPNDDIAILIGAALNDVATLNHEAIHVLRARNLFKDGEWSALREAADKKWLKRYDIAERYGDLDREGQIEEAIAEAFADWTQGNLDLADKAKGPMAKIRRFFKALMEALRGQGITSPAEIFKAIEAGDVGARDAAVPADATRKFQRPATAMKTEARQALADATNTATVPDRRIWDEAVRRNGNLLNRAGGAKGAIMDNIDELRVEFQDMMLPLLRAEQAIAAATGQEISKAESAYYAEERYTGRVGRRLDVLREEYTEPMAYMIAQSDAPIKLTDQNGQVREGADAVDLWLTARHAEERNALVQQRDPNMTSGSGMTDAEAQAVLKQASGQPFMPVLQRIGDMADQLGKDMIQWREDAGLLSTTEANAWRAMFKHYVPLKGFAETDMYDAIANEPTVRRGRKYNVTGKEAKAITGRSSEAFSPLATMLAMAEEVTVRAEKNLVMQSFYNLATKYPNPAMWKTQDVKTKRVFNRNTGRVETRLMDAAQTNLGPNEIALKINGEEKRIELVDPRLEKALSSVGAVPQFNRITRAASAFSRYFSAVNTMLSPPFVIVNAFRDMITAQFNLGQLPKEIRGKVKKAAVRDWIKAFSGSYQGLGDTNAQGEWAQYFHEFAESGAKVSFFKLELPGARQHEFAKQIKLNTGNKAMRGAKKLKRLNTDDNPVLKVIERLNLAVDNAVRLSVFMEARKQGMTIEEASSLSKNLTVNFNRKGSATAVMNAWFPFFNAAVQGSQVIFKATTHKRVAASVAGATVLGLALDLLNAHLSDEDEDGDLKYDKIPNYIGERNLIIPGPGDSYFTIPLPYGYNAFFYAGQQMGKTMRGVKGTDDAALDTVSAAFAGFSPLSGETVTQTVMPTLGDHLLELATNRDWLGRPIRPKNPWDDIGPKSQKMYKNEPPEVYQKVATGLNALTGGDEGRAGWLDVSPEYLHHTAKFLGGGAGRFADRMIETGTNLARGDTDLIEAHRVPLARVLHYSHGDWLNQGRYFDFKTEVEKADHEYEIKRENGNTADVSEDAKKALRLRGPLKLAEKQRRKLAKEINAVYANPNLTDRQRQDRLEPLYDRRNDIYVTFNKRFIDAMGPQAE